LRTGLKEIGYETLRSDHPIVPLFPRYGENRRARCPSVCPQHPRHWTELSDRSQRRWGDPPSGVSNTHRAGYRLSI